jgi:DNA-repair protein XRCC2
VSKLRCTYRTTSHVTQALETRIDALDSCLASDSLRWGDIVHIHGPSGSGKSLLVYWLLVACCIPLNYLTDHLGGWSKVAFVLDMDGTFDIDQFRLFLVERLAKSVPSGSLHQVLGECLKRVHIFRPHSTDQLAATLVHLPRYHSNNFPNAVMGMVVIHSLEAFHWVDQFKAEQLKPSTPHTRKTMHQHIFTTLDNLRRSSGAVGVISHWGLPNTQDVVASSDTLRELDVASNSPQLFRTICFHLGADLRKDATTEQSGTFYLTSDWFNMS